MLRSVLTALQSSQWQDRVFYAWYFVLGTVILVTELLFATAPVWEVEEPEDDAQDMDGRRRLRRFACPALPHDLSQKRKTVLSARIHPLGAFHPDSLAGVFTVASGQGSTAWSWPMQAKSMS